MKRNNRLYLIRHGQIDGYENVPVCGHTDRDLTEIGVLQIQRIAERLRFVEPKAIFSSDLKRSAKGAQMIASYHNVPFSPLPELREMNFGDWEGLSLLEIQNSFPEELRKRQADLIHYQIPGQGETIARFSERIINCLGHILEEQKNNDIVIVGHGGVNRIILCNALGLNLTRMFNIHQDYGCLNIIDYFGDFPLVRLVNG